jgi:hypothetical protein
LIRIVGVQRNANPNEEFVLLQNQGALRVNLRGHLLVSDSVFMGASIEGASHAFGDDVLIPAGAYVLLHSGAGEPRWARTKDFAYVYHVYAGVPKALWDRDAGPVHVLALQHTYVERREALLMR